MVEIIKRKEANMWLKASFFATIGSALFFVLSILGALEQKVSFLELTNDAKIAVAVFGVMLIACIVLLAYSFYKKAKKIKK